MATVNKVAAGHMRDYHISMFYSDQDRGHFAHTHDRLSVSGGVMRCRFKGVGPFRPDCRDPIEIQIRRCV